MGSKVLRSIYLDITQIEKIKKLSERTNVPQAVYVREGLDFILRKYEEQIDTKVLNVVAEKQS
jgi:predicted DNA-binding protein